LPKPALTQRLERTSNYCVLLSRRNRGIKGTEQFMIDFRNEKTFQSFKAGDTIFVKGSQGQKMYAVVTGEVEIRLGEQYLATAYENEIFGEMALVEKQDRIASAIAVKNSNVAVIDSKRFDELMGNKEFAMKVLHAVSSRLRTEMKLKPFGS